MKVKTVVYLIALLALVSLMIIPGNATPNYTYWEDHYVYHGTNTLEYSVYTGVPANGFFHLYDDTPMITYQTPNEYYTENEVTGISPYCEVYNGGNICGNGQLLNGHVYLTNKFASSSLANTTFTVGYDGGVIQYFLRGTPGTQSGQWIPVGPQYIIHYGQTTPLIPDWTVSPAQPWVAPINVVFTEDASTGRKPDSYLWEINGPNYYAYSTGQEMNSFNATFITPGDYLVSLHVSNGTDIEDSSLTYSVLNEAGSYSLTMSPETGTTATNFSAIVTAGVDELGATLNQFTIHCTVDGQVSYCTTNGKDPIFIKQEDGNWYLDGDLYSGSFPSNVTLKFNVPGVHTVIGWFFTTDPTDLGTEVSDTVTVTSTPGQVKLSVEVRDSSTNALVGGSDILLKKEDGTWDNQTVGTGSRDYYVNGGSNIGVGATAPGYVNSSIEYARFYENAKKVVLLNRISTGVPEGNNTLSVYVRKGGVPDVVGLEGATVKLNDGQTKQTPASGLAQFLVLDDETYFITVSKYGYITTSKYFSVNGATNAVTIELMIPGVTTTATLAPGETTIPIDPATTYPPGVPMPGTTITYPPGVPIIGGDGTATNATARDIATRNLDTWAIYGGTILGAVVLIMFVGFSGDALKKWSWIWK